MTCRPACDTLDEYHLREEEGGQIGQRNNNNNFVEFVGDTPEELL